MTVNTLTDNFGYNNRIKLENLILQGNWNMAKKFATNNDFNKSDKDYFNSLINKRLYNDPEWGNLYGKELLSLILKSKYNSNIREEKTELYIEPKKTSFLTFCSIVFDYVIYSLIIILLSHLLLINYQLSQEIIHGFIFLLIIILIIKSRVKQ